MREVKVSARAPTGQTIRGVLTKPDGQVPAALAILMHGFSTGKDNRTNRLLVPLLDSSGLATLRFDFRGHYESTGTIAEVTITSGVDDAQSIVEEVCRSDGELAEITKIAFGTSYGGAVAIAYARRSETVALTLKSPAVDVVEMQRRLRGRWGMLAWRLRGWATVTSGDDEEKRLNYTYITDAKRYDLYVEGRDAGIPILCVHGSKDELIPVEQSHRLVGGLGERGTLRVLDGADHRYSDPDQFEQMIEICADGMREQASASR